MRRIIGFFLIIGLITGAHLVLVKHLSRPAPEPGLNLPSPALGQAIATTFHQALTDPYFAPLENLVRYLNENPGIRDISIDVLTKWALDDKFPTCFVLDVKKEGWEIDHPTSLWVLDEILSCLRTGMLSSRKKGSLSVVTPEIEGETWWLGYIRIPPDAHMPDKIAGVFFSIDRYLAEDVPRFVDNVATRSRFPMVPFQQTAPVDMSRMDGHISIRILDDNGEVYLQRGRSFDPENLIYSELQFYQRPIVCMQQGWDLQVFSTNAKQKVDESSWKKGTVAITIITVLLISLVYWFGTRAGKV